MVRSDDACTSGVYDSLTPHGHTQALKSLNRRLDETKLFYHNSPEEISNTSRIFFQVFVLCEADQYLRMSRGGELFGCASFLEVLGVSEAILCTKGRSHQQVVFFFQEQVCCFSLTSVV